jgi:DNA helicase-2/ATP-dependent DNA helicase PcrA
MKADFLKELNEPQRQAVENVKGPSLVIAGAGSGKTRVLTYRIAYLLSQGVPPWKILPLTFTNKAAKEMKERIGQLVGHDIARQLWMGTFHSVFARILRSEADKLGYPKSFTIYDTLDSRNLVKTIVKELQLDDKSYKPSQVYGRISSAKNNLITARAYTANAKLVERDRQNKRPMLHEIFKRYAARCFKAGAMDFDDLLLNTNILFRDFPDVLKRYQDKFEYILVDEYQDTNFSQYLIIKKLAERHQNVCVVGDDAQSIYAFRGAKIENMLNFKNDYKKFKLYKLEQNYRSTQNIVNAANSIIAKNKGQIPKEVWSGNHEGDKIRVLKAMTDSEEGYLVANEIVQSRLTDHLPYKDFAILYRTNSQSRVFEEAMRKKNIPYKVYGSLSFYQRKEIKDLLAYLRLIVNPDDDEALKRVINYPTRGIGNKSVEKIGALAASEDTSYWQVIVQPNLVGRHLPTRTYNKVREFVEMIRGFAREAKEKNAHEMGQHVAAATGMLKEFFQDKSQESLGRYENVQELLNAMQEFTMDYLEENGRQALLEDYLENVALLTDMDTEKPEDQDKVTLMTIHSAKGLEFENVYIAGMEEELFPSQMSVSTEQELEEERRLFYVAVTRAKRKVTLSYANSRFKWGSIHYNNPSRFLNDIDEVFLEAPLETEPVMEEIPTGKPVRKNKYQQGPSPSTGKKNLVPMEKIGEKTKNMASNLGNSNNLQKFAPDDPGKFQAGMLVEHPRFGKGKILNIEGTPPNSKATVFFNNSGQKQLLLKFAKLRIIES